MPDDCPFRVACYLADLEPGSSMRLSHLLTAGLLVSAWGAQAAPAVSEPPPPPEAKAEARRRRDADAASAAPVDAPAADVEV